MKTILVVESEQESISTLVEILDKFGYNTITERNSGSALSLLKERAAVDLLIVEERLSE